MSRRILYVSPVVLIVLAAVAAVLLLSSRSALEHGLQAMHQAQAEASSPDAGANLSRTLSTTRVDMQQAHGDFTVADSRLSLMAPLLRHLSWVPGVGGELSVAPSLAHTANASSAGVVALLDGLSPLLTRWTTAPPRTRLQATLARAASVQGRFVRASALFSDARRARAEISTTPTPQVADALHSFDQEVPRLAVLSSTLGLFPRLLGYRTPQTYLIAYQDQNELRATGGFIGGAGILRLQNGAASQVFQGTWLDDNLSIPPPQPVAFYNGEPGWLFRDSNWSPDFPTTANLERFFLRLDLRRDVNSVINLTADGAAAVLQATGPLYVPEYHRWVTAGNVGTLADYYAHWASSSGPKRPGSADTQRKEFIPIVGQHFIAALSSLPASRWSSAMSDIGTAIARRDISIYFRDPAQENVLRMAGATGEVNPTTSDYLFVVDTNLSYNKINPHIHMQESYDVRVRPDRWLQAHLTLRFRNVPDPRYEPFALGPGAGSNGGWDDYADFVRIYVPVGAQLIDQAGWTQPWMTGAAYGKTMFSGYLIVRRGETRTVRLQYVIPPNVWTWSDGRAYRLVIQHQGGSHPDALHVSLHGDHVPRQTWSVQNPNQDWTRTVTVEQRPFRPIPLSPLPPPVVAPGHQIEPYAYLGSPS